MVKMLLSLFFNQSNDTSYQYETDEIFFPTNDPKNTIVCLTGHNRQTYLDGITTPISDNSVYNRPPHFTKFNLTNSTTINLSIDSDLNSPYNEIRITNALGTILSTYPINDLQNTKNFYLNLPESKGIYYVCIISNGVIVDSRKILK